MVARSPQSLVSGCAVRLQVPGQEGGALSSPPPPPPPPTRTHVARGGAALLLPVEQHLWEESQSRLPRLNQDSESLATPSQLNPLQSGFLPTPPKAAPAGSRVTPTPKTHILPGCLWAAGERLTVTTAAPQSQSESVLRAVPPAACSQFSGRPLSPPRLTSTLSLPCTEPVSLGGEELGAA